MAKTEIQDLGPFLDNRLFIKREDLLPFSFGGNKARKAELFFREIENAQADSVVTYGSASSNHCRIIANECCRRGLPCFIISSPDDGAKTFNRQMMELFGARITVVPVEKVHETIERILKELREQGGKPYFIEGGGHGNIGTEAYVQCYGEIRKYEAEKQLWFDYIFLASGTGTTQAGLAAGQILAKEDRRIVGISIARKNPRGRDVVLESVRSYLGARGTEEEIQNAVIFRDEYTDGYGKDDAEVTSVILEVLRKFGIPLDSTYTGKAFRGMRDMLRKENVKGKNILFIHTGGTPLFFDTLRKQDGAL
ncbi:MAG: pyridoxal-phosphate dependent enzyme [Lachnospiraceae bacterium]|nr:pyridoxal-phosphate dependent enzyme [Lachnospiraceae bacterium]